MSNPLAVLRLKSFGNQIICFVCDNLAALYILNLESEQIKIMLHLAFLTVWSTNDCAGDCILMMACLHAYPVPCNTRGAYSLVVTAPKDPGSDS